MGMPTASFGKQPPNQQQQQEQQQQRTPPPSASPTSTWSRARSSASSFSVPSPKSIKRESLTGVTTVKQFQSKNSLAAAATAVINGGGITPGPAKKVKLRSDPVMIEFIYFYSYIYIKRKLISLFAPLCSSNLYVYIILY